MHQNKEKKKWQMFLIAFFFNGRNKKSEIF